MSVPLYCEAARETLRFSNVALALRRAGVGLTECDNPRSRISKSHTPRMRAKTTHVSAGECTTCQATSRKHSRQLLLM